jgi:hypothetical protein
MQYAVALSSTFSTINFCKDQRTLQGGADSLAGYLQIGAVWLISNALVMWASYGTTGLIAAIVSNLLIMAWVYFSYQRAFRIAARRNNLKHPQLRFTGLDDDVV